MCTGHTTTSIWRTVTSFRVSSMTPFSWRIVFVQMLMPIIHQKYQRWSFNTNSNSYRPQKLVELWMNKYAPFQIWIFKWDKNRPFVKLDQSLWFYSLLKWNSKECRWPALNTDHVSSQILGLIHKAYLAEKNGTPFEIWGTGKPLRQFIYSLDLVRVFL